METVAKENNVDVLALLQDETQSEENQLLNILERAECLWQLGRHHEAIFLFAQCLTNPTRSLTVIKANHSVTSSTSSPVDACSQSLSQFTRLLSEWCISSCLPEEVVESSSDAWSCSQCDGLLCDPVALPCGHNYCKKCLMEEPLLESCKKCGLKFRHYIENAGLHVNIVVNKLCQKFWPKELQGIVLRCAGNKRFQQGDLHQALELYSRANEANPGGDHLVLSNRSHVYLKLGSPSLALADAEAAIDLRPDWGKGYYRKAMALQQLQQHHDAFKALCHCLRLQPSDKTSLQLAMVKSLKALVRQIKEERDEFEIDRGEGTLRHMLERALSTMEEVIKSELGSRSKIAREVDSNLVDASDFECSLCLRLLLQPVTTLCGHTYCRTCLARSLDHSCQCPMCKADLSLHLAERREAVDEFVATSIERLLSAELEDRLQQHEREMKEVVVGRSRLEGSNKTEVPVFVCTTAFPTVPCPLHVFEPRYRLMMRRAMESGLRQFAMCAHQPTNGEGQPPFVEYGTLLEMRELKYFPDGRSVVDTVGGRRFRVLRHGMHDGYHTAIVDFIRDQKVHNDNLLELQKTHDETLVLARVWFEGLQNNHKEHIASHYGLMPEVEEDYWELPDGPSWLWWLTVLLPLDPHIQVQLLSQTRLQLRMESIQRILIYLRGRR